MDYKQNPITPSTHPETGPANTFGSKLSGNPTITAGEIRFDQPALPKDPLSAPRATIATEGLRTPLRVAQERADQAILRTNAPDAPEQK